jgi:hypothetical protein
LVTEAARFNGGKEVRISDMMMLLKKVVGSRQSGDRYS